LLSEILGQQPSTLADHLGKRVTCGLIERHRFGSVLSHSDVPIGTQELLETLTER
jgi:hypothetical protein